MLWIDDFKHYGLGAGMVSEGGYASTGGASVVAGAGRFGGNGVRVTQALTNPGLRKRLAAPVDDVSVACAAMFSALPQNSTDCAIFQAGRVDGILSAWAIFTINISATGRVQFRAARSDTIQGGRNGPVIASSAAPVVRAGCYHFFEARATFRSNGLDVIVLVDGVEVINATASYLIPGPPVSTPTDITVLGSRGASGLGAANVDTFGSDVAILTGVGVDGTDELHDRRVYTQLPNADGALQDWTISTGSSSAAILATVPPSDGQRYLSAPDAGDRVSVGAADLGAVSDISAVMTTTRLWGNSPSVEVGVQIDSGGTPSAHDSHDIGTRPAWYGDVQETDPATGVAWTASGVNAAEIIIDRTV